MGSTFEQPASSRLRTRTSRSRRRAASSVVGLFAVSIALHTTQPANLPSACRLRAGLARPSGKRTTRAIRARTSAVVAKLDFGLVGAASRLGKCFGMSTLPYLGRSALPQSSPAVTIVGGLELLFRSSANVVSRGERIERVPQPFRSANRQTCRYTRRKPVNAPN